MLKICYNLNEATPKTQNIREIRKETTFYLKNSMEISKLGYNNYDYKK